MPMPHARSESSSLPAILLLLATMAKRGGGGRQVSMHMTIEMEGMAMVVAAALTNMVMGS